MCSSVCRFLAQELLVKNFMVQSHILRTVFGNGDNTVLIGAVVAILPVTKYTLYFGKVM